MTRTFRRFLAWLAASPRARIGLLLALAVTLPVELMRTWHRLLPQFDPIAYQYDKRTLETGAMPLSVPSMGKRLRIRTQMRLGRLHPRTLSILPDDCLEKLVVDDVTVELKDHLCFHQGGGSVTLPMLKAGINKLEIEVSDHGGRGGIAISVASTDDLFRVFLALSVLGLVIPTWIAARTARVPRLGLLTAILGVAIVARVALVSSPGYGADVNLFAGWARSAAKLGVGASYLRQIDGTSLPNYPPLWLYVSGGLAKLYDFLLDPAGGASSSELKAFLRFPAIACDVICAAICFRLLKKARRRVAGLVALAVALNPATLYDSAVWGQVDAVPTVFALVALVAATSGWSAMCGAFVALALLTKLQAIVFLPIIATVCFLQRGVIRAALAGLVVSVVVILPLGSAPAIAAMIKVYVHSSGFYPVLSMEAYNLWTFLFGYKEQGRSDGGLLFELATYRHVGIGLFFATTVVFTYRAYRFLGPVRRRVMGSLDVKVAMIAGCLCVYAFFLFNTEMHERYVVPFAFFGAALLDVDRRARAAYLLGSALVLVNLLGALSFSRFDKALFHELPNVPVMVGALHLVVFTWIARTFWRLTAPRWQG